MYGNVAPCGQEVGEVILLVLNLEMVEKYGWAVGEDFDDVEKRCFLKSIGHDMEYATENNVHNEDFAYAQSNKSPGHNQGQRPFTPNEIKILDVEHRRRKAINSQLEHEYGIVVEVLTALNAALAVRGERELFGFIALPASCLGGLQKLLQNYKVDLDESKIERDFSSDRIFPYAADPDEDPNHIEFRGAEMPRAEETAAEIAQRIGITEERFQKVMGAWQESGGNLEIFRALTGRHCAPNAPIKSIVEGLLLAKTVSLLVGPSGIGKSTLALQMGCCVASSIPFCGLETSGGRVIYLTGEDSREIIEKRQQSLERSVGTTDNILIFDKMVFGSLENALSDLSVVENIALLIVDTAAAFCPQVNDAAPVREFMGALAGFAASRKCAIFVIHHVNKNVSNNSAKSVYDGMKGSNEFTGAARAVMTLHREKNTRVLSLMKHNLASSMRRLAAPLRLEYDPSTELHEPIDPPVLLSGIEIAQAGSKVPAETASGQVAGKGDPLADGQIVAAVVNRRLAEGGRVAVTGENEPYTYSAAELMGWPRARVRAAHKAAIGAGLIVKPH